MEKSLSVKFNTDIFSLVFLPYNLLDKFTAKLLTVLQILCIVVTNITLYSKNGIISRNPTNSRKITFAPCNENKLFIFIFPSNQFLGDELPVTSSCSLVGSSTV